MEEIHVGASIHLCDTSTASPITGNRFQTKTSSLFGPLAGFSGTTVQSTGVNSGSMHNVDYGYAKGNTLAVFDGLGGHPDTQEKEQIAAISKAAATHTVKKVLKLGGAIDWKAQLSQCFVDTGAYVSQWFRKTYPRHPLKHACGTVVRIDKNPKGNNFIARAASVGDCMAFAWNPKTKKFTQVSSARQLGIYACVNPQSITDFAKANFKVFYNECPLDKHDIVFCVSDGVHELLPHTTSTEKVADDQYYLRSDLDATAITDILSAFESAFENIKAKQPSLRDYTNFFKEYVITASEANRKEIFGDANIVTKTVDFIATYLKIADHNNNYNSFAAWLSSNADENSTIILQKCLNFLGIAKQTIDEGFTIQYLLQLLIPYQKNNVAANEAVEIGDDATLIAYQCR